MDEVARNIKHEKEIRDLKLFLDLPGWIALQSDLEGRAKDWDKEMHKAMANEKFNRATWCSGFAEGLRLAASLPHRKLAVLEKKDMGFVRAMCEGCGETATFLSNAIERWCRKCGNVLRKLNPSGRYSNGSDAG